MPSPSLNVWILRSVKRCDSDTVEEVDFTGFERIELIDYYIDFWGPVSNFGVPIAAAMDTQKSPEL